MQLSSVLWRRTPSYEKSKDTDGILERYCIALGDALDQDFVALADAFPKVVASPSSTKAGMLRHHLDSLGLQRVSANLAGSALLATYMPSLIFCKSSVRFLNYAYSYYGVSVVDVSYNLDFPRMDYDNLFDSGVPMDSSGTYKQKTCTMYLEGPDVPSLDFLATLVAIAVWNLTPYIRYSEVYYNGEPILSGIIMARIGAVTAPESETLAAGELEITVSTEGVSFELLDGNLYITVAPESGLRAQNFVLQEGILTYVN